MTHITQIVVFELLCLACSEGDGTLAKICEDRLRSEAEVYGTVELLVGCFAYHEDTN